MSLVAGAESAGGVNHLGYLAESVLFCNEERQDGDSVHPDRRRDGPLALAAVAAGLSARRLAGGRAAAPTAPDAGCGRHCPGAVAYSPHRRSINRGARQPAMMRMHGSWFFLPFAVAMFVVQEPGLHFYYFFVPWFLLLGRVGRAGTGCRPAHAEPSWPGACCNEVRLHLWPARRVTASFWLPMRASSLTKKPGDHTPGGPCRPGNTTTFLWHRQSVRLEDRRAVGRRVGVPLATNIDRWTVDWYNRGAEYCRSDPALAAIDATSKLERGADMIAALEGSLQPVGAILRR